MRSIGNSGTLRDDIFGQFFAFGWFVGIRMGIGIGGRKGCGNRKSPQRGCAQGMNEMFAFHSGKIINSAGYWVLISCNRSCKLVLPLKVFSSMQ